MIIKQAVKTEDSDMELINKYTRRELSPEEVYTFSITLCDNEIDRDMEAFSTESLNTLSKLFLGKTGIFDHNPKAENQAARIYKTGVELTNEMNSVGEQYARLTACAYIIRTEKMADLISEIDAGIKKEVSIGCAVNRIVCSKCGADLKAKPCNHRKGEDGVYHVLDEPTDAYEWSFVAVPSQRAAGVTKKFETEVKGQNKELDSNKHKQMTKQGGENMIFNDETNAKIKEILDSGKSAAISKDGDNYVVSEVAEGKPMEAESLLTAEQAKEALGLPGDSEVKPDFAVKALSSIKGAGIDAVALYDFGADALKKWAKETATPDTKLVAKAAERDVWFERLVKNALDNGVRAEGDSFDSEWWESILKSQPMDKVKAQSDRWVAKFDEQFGDCYKRKSRDPSANNTAAIPDDCFEI